MLPQPWLKMRSAGPGMRDRVLTSLSEAAWEGGGVCCGERGGQVNLYSGRGHILDTHGPAL